MKNILTFLLCLFAVTVFGKSMVGTNEVVEFKSLNTNQFATNGGKLIIKSGVVLTNVAVYGGLKNNGNFTNTQFAHFAGNTVMLGTLTGNGADFLDFITAGNGFIGPGGSITALNATSLATGIVPRARLGTNTPTLGQILSATGADTKWIDDGGGGGIGTNGGQLKIMSATVTNINGTYVNLSELTLTGLEAGETYQFQLVAFTQGTNASGDGFNIDLAGGTATASAMEGYSMYHDAGNDAGARNNSLTNYNQYSVGQEVRMYVIQGSITVGTSGTLIPRFRREIIFDDAPMVLKNSYFMLNGGGGSGGVTSSGVSNIVEGMTFTIDDYAPGSGTNLLGVNSATGLVAVALSSIGGSGGTSTFTEQFSSRGGKTNYVLRPGIPIHAIFWDSFEREDTALGVITPAPSISPVTGTNYTWSYNPTFAGFGTNCAITNGMLIFRTSGNTLDATYPQVDVGFKPTHGGARIRAVPTGISGADVYPQLFMLLSPVNTNIDNSYHFGIIPANGPLIGFWYGGLSNIAVATCPEWVQAYNQDITFQWWIDGDTARFDIGGCTFITTNDSRFASFGGRYLTYENYNSLSTNRVYDLQILEVWAGVNIHGLASNNASYKPYASTWNNDKRPPSRDEVYDADFRNLANGTGTVPVGSLPNPLLTSNWINYSNSATAPYPWQIYRGNEIVSGTNGVATETNNVATGNFSTKGSITGGSVGIGTVPTLGAVHALSPAGTGTRIIAQAGGTGVNDFADFSFYDSSGNVKGAFRYISAGGSGYGGAGSINFVQVAAAPLTFGTDNLVRMTIDSLGKVGIGDTTPAALLTVGNGDLFQVNSLGGITSGSSSTNNLTGSRTLVNSSPIYTNEAVPLSYMQSYVAANSSSAAPVSTWNLFTPTNVTTTGLYNAWPFACTETNGDVIFFWQSGSSHTNLDGSINWQRMTNTTGVLGPVNVVLTNAVAQPIYSAGIDSSNRWHIIVGYLSNAFTTYQLNEMHSDTRGASWVAGGAVPQTDTSAAAFVSTNQLQGKIIECANYRLLAGTYDFGADAGISQAWCIYSDNGGTTWNTNFISGSLIYGLGEPRFVYLGNSNVLCLLRTETLGASSTNHLFQHHSTDNGATWVADGFVTLGLASDTGRNPAGLYSYVGERGRRVVLAWGNRTSQQLELREVAAHDVLRDRTVWDSATVETFGARGSLGGDIGGGYPSIVGLNGNLLIVFYADTSLTNAYIRILQR